ncbi:MAG: excinuclease ABC subunit UvrA [Anaerolineales bacterium]|nr:excinuclease ABC subunit UvrA [Anaerolineales bacterium]
MTGEVIRISRAREHNLKNLSVTIPKNKLVVVTGLSGSGKSSLAFDTLFAEGQRRYVESLSAYARQFLGQLRRPDVDGIDGLSPAVAIDQRGLSANPRSTVGTVTEIYDYLRLLYARAGVPHCPVCGRRVEKQSAQEIAAAVAAFPPGTRLALLAPAVRSRKGAHEAAIEEMRRAGFVRMRIDGRFQETDAEPGLDPHIPHDLEAVVDRLVIPDAPSAEFLTRLTDSVETALRSGDGFLIVHNLSADPPADSLFSERFACPVDGISLPDIQPHSFSFNSPHGACPACQGLGSRLEIDPARLFPDPSQPLDEAVLSLFAFEREEGQRSQSLWIESLAARLGFDPESPVGQISPERMRPVLYGTGAEKIRVEFPARDGKRSFFESPYEGLIPYLRRRYEESASETFRGRVESLMRERVCEDCRGKRLRKESLAVTVAGRNIVEICDLTVSGLRAWVEELRGADVLRGEEGGAVRRAVAAPILAEVGHRLEYLEEVGVGYLALSRTAASLSGGEGQRVRMATQIGSRLSGVLYVLDEPSLGLHPHDTRRLLASLLRLRGLDNTVLVVEHDEEIVRTADWIIELGPGAGPLGGELTAQGTPQDLQKKGASLTGRFLKGEFRFRPPKKRRAGNGDFFTVGGARANNLKNVTARIPLGMLVCITGVSGSGKSSLLFDVVLRALAVDPPGEGPWDSVAGREHIDKVIPIDQTPIGRTPRSNPASYVGFYAELRELFAALPESKVRGYRPGRFSFNARGGRCEACQGQGQVEISMQFLPDVFIPCEVCGGARFNRETLQVRFKDRTIADVLELTVDPARELFAAFPGILRKLDTLHDVGLGYIRIGQPATTLSGGEAQRVKLARELARRSAGHTFYILDEPTIGLHAADVRGLIDVLQRLVGEGHTVCVIEHHPDILAAADHLIDLGPEGGDLGGRIVAEGTPEQVAQADTHTGRFLRALLARSSAGPVKAAKSRPSASTARSRHG